MKQKSQHWVWIECFGRSQNCQSNAGIAFALGGPPDLHSKILVLKTLHTLSRERGEIDLELTGKLPPRELVFIMKDGPMQVTCGRIYTSGLNQC